MGLKRTGAATAIAATLTILLAGCGGDDATEKAEKAVESVAGKSDADLKGNSPLDAAAYALVSVQSQKYDDYEIDGDTVRLKVRKGVTLGGAECTIIGAATGADHPDAKFVLVESDGTETTC